MDELQLDLLLPPENLTNLPFRVVSFTKTTCDEFVDKYAAPACCGTILLKTDKVEDLQAWLQEFSEFTNTNYISTCQKTVSTGKKYSFSNRYICQLASKNKISTSKRNLNCTASVHLKVKKMPKRPTTTDYADGYLGIVEINWNHNHLITNMNSLSHLRIADVVKQRAEALFQSGIGVGAVKQIIADSIEEDELQTEGFACKFYSHQLNPSLRQLYHIYHLWRAEHYGVSEVQMQSALEKRKYELIEKGFEVTSHVDDSLICCITTPTMRRAASMQSAREVLFVDSTAGIDSKGVSVTFILTATPAGAIPLCVLLHHGQSEEVYFKSFSLAVSSGKVQPPAVLMTDDSDAERNALKRIFPDTVLLFCIFHRAQAAWRWLADGSHGIGKEVRQELMQAYSLILYAESPDCAEEHMIAIRECYSELYPQFVAYLEQQWEQRADWIVCFRAGLPTRGHNTNNFAEATIRIVKDIILCRQRSFNMVAFIEYFVDAFERYLRAKILTAVNADSNSHIRKYKKTVVKAEGLLSEVINATDTEGVFKVKQYEVDVTKGFCSCFVGSTGACCKHQILVAVKQGCSLPNVPVLNSVQKQSLYFLAIGDNAVPLSFFDDLCDPSQRTDIVGQTMEHQMTDDESAHCQGELENIEMTNQEVECNDYGSSGQLDTRLDEVQRNAVSSVKNFLEGLLCEVNELENRSDSSLLSAVTRLNRTIQPQRSFAENINVWCNNASVRRRQRIIRVQPTAASRRSKTSYRGGKSLTSSQVRSHRLSQVIKMNVMPAKKH